MESIETPTQQSFASTAAQADTQREKPALATWRWPIVCAGTACGFFVGRLLANDDSGAIGGAWVGFAVSGAVWARLK